jgi:hypothetical protein
MSREHLRKSSRKQTSSPENSSINGADSLFSERKAGAPPPLHWDAMPLDTIDFIADWEPEVRPDAQKPVRSVTAKRMDDPAFAITVFTAVKLNLSDKGKL